MFYNFNAHKPAPDSKSHEPNASSLLAERIFQKAVSLQRKWATFMGLQTARLSNNRLKSLCLGILISASVYSAYLICDGMIALTTYAIPYRIHPLWSFDPSDKKLSARKAFAFEQYLDSLHQVFVQDSILLFNPNQPSDATNRH